MANILIFIVFLVVTACENTSSQKNDTRFDKDEDLTLSSDKNEYQDNLEIEDDFEDIFSDREIDDLESNDETVVGENDFEDKKDDEKIDEDSQTFDGDNLERNIEQISVSSEGGEFLLFGGRLKIFFPQNWSNKQSDIVLKEIEKGAKYSFLYSPERFFQPVKVSISVFPFLRTEEEFVVASLSDNKFIRLNRVSFDENFLSANISFPVTFSLAPRGSAVCPGDDNIQKETRNIYTPKVYNKNHEIVTVDICMDRYEASLVSGSGTLGNADQSVAATALVASKPGEIPLSNVSFYQAKQLCLNSGKELCGELEWQVACEGSYNPHDPSESPCFYGLSGAYCLNFDETVCHLKKNHQLAEAEYENSLYECTINYQKCGSSVVCDTAYQNCKSNALAKYNSYLKGGNYPLCHSVFEIDNMVGNLNEWILYQNSDGSAVEGVLRGGSFVNGGTAQSDLRCRPESAPGFKINPLSQLPTVGFRCCIY